MCTVSYACKLWYSYVNFLDILSWEVLSQNSPDNCDGVCCKYAPCFSSDTVVLIFFTIIKGLKTKVSLIVQIGKVDIE